MIKNIDSTKQKYDAKEVYIDNINIIDYINNKFVKLQNDLTSFVPFEFGVNMIDYDTTLNTTQQNLVFTGEGINHVAQYYGAKNLFTIHDDYIEYIGENTQNGSNDFDEIYFTVNFRGLTSTAFNVDQFNTIRIQVTDSNGTEKLSSYQAGTVPSQNTRYPLSSVLICNLVKGDKIYFKYYSQRSTNVSINKVHISITHHANIPDEYYQFKY